MPRPRVGDRARRAAPVTGIGELPSPLDRPPGCVFSSRCPLADERCRTEQPVLRPVHGDRSAACHYAETAQAVA